MEFMAGRSMSGIADYTKVIDIAMTISKNELLNLPSTRAVEIQVKCDAAPRAVRRMPRKEIDGRASRRTGCRWIKLKVLIARHRHQMLVYEQTRLYPLIPGFSFNFMKDMSKTINLIPCAHP
ncbi:hypothetical protein GW17_00000985 [Ensete ventricosum]|nr:hypothetical protein GW17_00000985 [Ensete ventricosum]